MVQKLAASDFSAHIVHILSAANLIPLEKGAALIRPIVIGIVLRYLLTRALMPEAISEAKDYLSQFQIGFGVRCVADAAVHEARTFIEYYGHDPT